MKYPYDGNEWKIVHLAKHKISDLYYYVVTTLCIFSSAQSLDVFSIIERTIVNVYWSFFNL